MTTRVSVPAMSTAELNALERKACAACGYPSDEFLADEFVSEYKTQLISIGYEMRQSSEEEFPDVGEALRILGESCIENVADLETIQLDLVEKKVQQLFKKEFSK